MASTTTNIGLTKPAGTDQALISAINGNMDIIDTKMGAVGNTSVQSQITSLSDQIATKYGEIATNITYEISGNIVTIYFNGYTVSTASGWTLIGNLPTGADTRYSAHFKAMSGHDIQCAGTTIKYRGSGGDIFGVCTYVRG